MKLTFLIYGLSVLFSYLLIRFGYSIDKDVKDGEDNNMRYWFGIMFVPIANIGLPIMAVVRLLEKRKKDIQKFESFLKYFFLSKKKVSEIQKEKVK